MFLKTGIFKAISFKNPVRIPISYWVLVSLRFILTLLPQTGYIHPDEFFQNMEVIAGDVFNVDIARTWEFSPKFPIRNIFVPKVIVGPPLNLIRIFNPYFKYYLQIDLQTPYYLLVIPRIFFCSLSLINDYCLYKICVLYGQNFRNRLVIFASSYVMFVFCCRSFSNAFEMIFFSILLYLVAECMYKSDKVIYHSEFLNEKYKEAKSPADRVKIFKLNSHLPEHSLSRVFIISTIVVVGIFNRPTFIGFALPPIFFWLHRGLGSSIIGFKDFHYRMFTFIVCGIPIALLLIVVDSSYYGYLTIADVESMKLSWDNWIVTPLNFLRYNMDTRNLKHHGLHPRWLHLVVNVPLLFNVLGGLAIITLSAHSYRFFRGQYSKLPRIQSITGLMLFSLVIPVAILSLFPHQEARFIIPVLVPLVYIYGNHLHPTECDTPSWKTMKKIFRYTWYITNICLTIFFGFIHQGGIYPFVNDLHREIKSVYGVQTHLVISHSYSIPTFLLQLESTTKLWKDKKTGHLYRVAPSTFIHKYGSIPIEELLVHIDEVLSDAELSLHESKKKYRFYVASPCSQDTQLKAVARKYDYFKLVEEFSHYPHFSSEALPQFPSQHDQGCIRQHLVNESQNIDLNILQRISCFFRQFCLKTYHVKAIV